MLVNGSHTTLAFLTLCLRQPNDAKKQSDYTKPGNHELINWGISSCGEDLHKEIWAWVSEVGYLEGK